MSRFNACLSTLLALTTLVPAASLAQGRGPFDDVPDSHWAANDVTDLAKRGIFLGYSDGEFKGKRGATRFEAAEVIARLHLEVRRMLSPFVDGPGLARGAQGDPGPDGPRGPQGLAGPMGPPGMPPAGFDELSRSLDELRTRIVASRDLSQALLDRMRAVRSRLRDVDAELGQINSRVRRVKPSPVR